MKKLTKRNRTHNRKAVFGYYVECGPGQIANHDTTLTFNLWHGWTYTCTYDVYDCCDV